MPRGSCTVCTGARVNPPVTNLGGKRARDNHPFLILEVMDVPRWAFSMRRQGALQLEDHFSIVFAAPQVQDLTGVPVLHPQATGHHCHPFNSFE